MPMPARRAALVAALLLALPGRAEASGHLYDRTVACPDFGVNRCTVRMFHTAFSWEMFDCAGSPGSYTSCDVTHLCQFDLDGGPFVVVVTGCDIATQRSSDCLPLNVSCDIDEAGSVTMVPGQCLLFGARVLAATMAGFVLGEPPTEMSHTIEICMTADGPVPS